MSSPATDVPLGKTAGKVGDSNTLAAIRANIEEALGPRYSRYANLDQDDLHRMQRALYGDSTEQEVTELGGFNGAWHSDVRDDLEQLINKMESCQGFHKRDCTKRKLDELNYIAPIDLSTTATEPTMGEIKQLLQDALTGQNKLSNRLTAIETGDKRQKTDDRPDQSPAGQADVVLREFNEIFDTDKGTEADQPASSDTAAAAGQQTEPPPVTVQSDQVKRKVIDFIKKAKEGATAGASKLLPEAELKAKTKALFDKMDTMSTAQLVDMAGGSDWMTELVQTDGKSTGLPSTEAVPGMPCAWVGDVQPNRKVAPGQFLSTYDFVTKSFMSAKELMAQATGSDQGVTFQIGETGLVVTQKPTLLREMTTFSELQNSANRFVRYARSYKGSKRVRHLHTEANFSGFSEYMEKLLRLSQKFKLRFVIEFDIRFQKQVYDRGQWMGPVPWLVNTTELFNEIFCEPNFTRLGDNQIAKDPADKRPADKRPADKRPPAKPTKTSKVTASGTEICGNYNRGFCLDKKMKDGRPCQRAHVCLVCGDGHPKTGNCD